MYHSNHAIRTKVTTHKPPRIYITALDLVEHVPYDTSKPEVDNHLDCARRFIGQYIPGEAISGVHSASLSDVEMVHIVQINPEYRPAAPTPVDDSLPAGSPTLEQQTPIIGDNTAHSGERETT